MNNQPLLNEKSNNSKIIALGLVVITLLSVTALISFRVSASVGTPKINDKPTVAGAVSNSNSRSTPVYVPVNEHSSNSGSDTKIGCVYEIRTDQMVSSCGGDPVPLPTILHETK